MRLLVLALLVALPAEAQFLGASNRSSPNSANCRIANSVPNDACSMPTGTLGSHDFTTVDIDTSGFLACYLMRDADPVEDLGNDSCLESGIADDLEQNRLGIKIQNSTDVPFGFSTDARSAVFLGANAGKLRLLDNAANGYKFDVDTSSFSAGCWINLDDGTLDFNFGKITNWSAQSDSPIGATFVEKIVIGASAISHTRPFLEGAGVWYNFNVRHVLPLGTGLSTDVTGDTSGFIASPGTVDKYFGIGHVPGNFFPLKGKITGCWFAERKLETVELCRLCRCGLKGDFVVDRRSFCDRDQVGRTKCAMSTNKCYSS